jgi:SAM-dependent methyltransferase
MASAGPVHLDRAVGRHVFGADAAGYHAGRIGYPDALYDRVFARCDAGPRTLEIGPGTGLATQALLARGVGKLVAVEPDPALSAYLVEILSDSRLSVVSVDFLRAPLSGPFDLAACACAFHWIDFAPGIARVRELLRPGGTWAMWWHVYRQPGADAFADALLPTLAALDLPMPPSEAGGGHYWLQKDLHLGRLREAGFVDVDYVEYRTQRWLDAAQMRALYASFSFVRQLPEDQRVVLLDHIADLVDTRFAGRAPNVIRSPLYLASKPD